MPDEPRKLPEWINTPVGVLSALSQEDRQNFNEIVRDEANLSRISALPTVVAERLKLAREDSIQVVSFLQWYSSRMASDPEFVDWFNLGAAGSGYSEDLVVAIEELANQVCFRIGSKALDLYLRAPYNGFRAQITSDIRPVWDTDQNYAVPPVAVTIMHTLQLECWGQASDGSETVFVTVDVADLRQLIKLSEAALRKQETLKELIGGLGLRYVQVGETGENGEEGS